MMNRWEVLGFITSKKFQTTPTGYICYFQVIQESVTHSKLDGKPKILKEMLDLCTFRETAVNRLNHIERGSLVYCCGRISQLRRFSHTRLRVPFLICYYVQKIIPPRPDANLRDGLPTEIDMKNEIRDAWFPSPETMEKVMKFAREHPEYAAHRVDEEFTEPVQNLEEMDEEPLRNLAAEIAGTELARRKRPYGRLPTDPPNGASSPSPSGASP